MTLFDEIIKFNELWLNDPHKIECEPLMAKNLIVLRCIWLPICHLCIAKDEPYAISEDSFSDYCRFARVLLSLRYCTGLNMTLIWE